MKNKWEIIKPTKKPGYSLCRCVCGTIKSVFLSDIKRGKSKSCGCNLITHGLSGKRVHRIHSAMMTRCYNKNAVNYKLYGGRGIRVSKRWHKFENFLSDMGFPPGNKQLDRINNLKSYSKNNCRWLTPKQNCRNKSNNLIFSLNGKTRTLVEWSEILGVSYQTLHSRYVRGSPIHKILR